MNHAFDVIVVGAGHAGCEAAYASARMGARTLLLTMNLDHIALMSCNPAVGGLAKGHLVREIDALGGIMARATDETGIQFRMLNTSRGPAVRAPRAQSDKRLYSQWMKQFLETVPNLDLAMGTAESLIVETRGGVPQVVGLRLERGSEIRCESVVLTTGTFLDGLIHIGDKSYPAGRAGDPAAVGMADSLRRTGHTTGRLKTGTPPRLHRRSVNWTNLEEQPGDDPPSPFSYLTRRIPQPQVSCYITYTTPTTHDIIRDNLHRSAMYGGHIESVGPRYCPSIEDKCVRFADKERHQIFLEPEGLSTSEIYVNGVSTSLPEDVQERFIRSIPGLENAHMTRVGYAIEYTYVPPSQVGASLESKQLRGLFLAGQINGTTGYEEAAAQGLLAGVNAVARLRGLPPLVLGRDEAYMGVLVDDLVTKEHTEPYRMFTSRAEYRLLLRQDNADLRLSERAYQLGLISEERYRQFESYRTRIRDEVQRLESTILKPSELPPDLAEEFELQNLDGGLPLAQYLARPAGHYEHLVRMGRAASPEDETAHRVAEQVELTIKYSGYIERQQKQVVQNRKLERTALPLTLDYLSVPGLRREAAQKLNTLRPETVGQASRIAGVNPADISVLLVYLKAHGSPAAPA